MADEEKTIITLGFDTGDEVECEVVGVFDVKEKEYIALIPNDGSDDLYIYGYKEINDEEYDIYDITDDREFQAAVDAFDAIMTEEE